MALPEPALVVSLVTNAVDGPTDRWMDGAINILASFAKQGRTGRARFATGPADGGLPGVPVDLVPMGGKVMIAAPSLPNPFTDASEISVTGADRGRISLALVPPATARTSGAFAGAMERSMRCGSASVRFLPEAKLAAELEQRYGG